MPELLGTKETLKEIRSDIKELENHVIAIRKNNEGYEISKSMTILLHNLDELGKKVYPLWKDHKIIVDEFNKYAEKENKKGEQKYAEHQD